MKRLGSFLLLVGFTCSCQLAAQSENQQIIRKDVLFTWQGDLSLYVNHGIIIYVSNEKAIPTYDGLFFTIENKSKEDVCYLAKVSEHTVNVNDPNRILIHTTANILSCYPIPSGSKQTVRVVEYQRQADIGLETYVQLSIEITHKNDESPLSDMDYWSRLFAEPAVEDAEVYQGDDRILYSGVNQALVTKLLTRVKGWRTPKSVDAKDGVPPSVERECMRDQYVAAAINYAWAAECYYRVGNNARATEMGTEVSVQIANAAALCSNTPTVYTGSDGKCPTESIIACSEIQEIGNTNVALGNNSEGQSDIASLAQVLQELLPLLADEGVPQVGTSGQGVPAIAGSLSGIDPVGSQVLQVAGTAVQLLSLLPTPETATQEEIQLRLQLDIDGSNKYFKEKYGYSLSDYTRLLNSSSLDSIRYLYSKGFPTDAYVTDNGSVTKSERLFKRAIHLAAEKNNLPLLRMLVEEYGVDADDSTGDTKKDKYDWSPATLVATPNECYKFMRPIFYAAIMGNSEIIDYLILQEVNIKKPLSCNCSMLTNGIARPWELAEYMGHHAMADKLHEGKKKR